MSTAFPHLPGLARRARTSACACATAFAFSALSAWFCPDASADEEPPRETPKREQQDYGGPEKGTTVGDVAVWPPRVVLFPLWLVSEYVLRKPIGALVVVAEREQWPQTVIDFFTFGDRRQVQIFPSALFDFGLKPSVGFNASWKYFLTDPNTISLHFGTWGPDWIAVRAVDTYAIGKHESLFVDANFWRRKDNPFYGMGPDAGNTRYRYQSQTAEASLGYTNQYWRESTFEVRSGFRHLQFGDGTCCEEPSVQEGVAEGRIAAPPGLGQGYNAAFSRVAATFDTRKPKPQEGSGIRLAAHGEGVFAPDGAERRAWINYGGSAGAALDMTGTERVIALNVNAELNDPLQGTTPFTDQVSLGGDNLMRGYLRNRLIDRSSLVATIRYTWPVWVYLDGVFQTDVGNVFGPHFEGFDPGLLRLSSGIGVRSNGERDSAFEILVAGGTDPFENGFHVSSFRLVIGSHHGF